jgi:hypothetical protein
MEVRMCWARLGGATAVLAMLSEPLLSEPLLGDRLHAQEAAAREIHSKRIREHVFECNQALENASS